MPEDVLQLTEPFVPRFKRWIGITMSIRNDKDRGPDPDVPLLGDEDIDRIVRLAMKYGNRPSYSNGGDESGISRWHLVIAVIGVIIPVIGAAWGLSMQISAQSAMISNIRDHQREQDERATRVEQQLQQLARDRR